MMKGERMKHELDNLYRDIRELESEYHAGRVKIKDTIEETLMLLSNVVRLMSEMVEEKENKE